MFYNDLTLIEDMNDTELDYDVVIDTLQKRINVLWNMSKNNESWGIMDQIRMEQIDRLTKAIQVWKEHNE
jgi:uncharacterized protein YpuA (DUF1002 family)